MTNGECLNAETATESVRIGLFFEKGHSQFRARKDTMLGKHTIRLVRRLRRRLFKTKGPAAGKIRLYLGSGLDYRPGYVNVDIDPLSAPDLTMDFRQIGDLYADGAVAEVVMIHTLGYLRLWEARELFAVIYRLLEDGGRLVIELPDIEKCLHAAMAARGNVQDYLEGMRGLYAFALPEVESRSCYVPYAFGWTAWHLEWELRRAGFHRVIISEPQAHGNRTWRDLRCEATKSSHSEIR